VAADDRLKSRLARIEAQHFQIVQKIDRGRSGLHGSRQRERSGPIAFIDIAPDRGHWRDLTKPRKNPRIADVAGMEEQVGARERAKSLIAQQPVRIGD
jgi:hypothetical protein